MAVFQFTAIATDNDGETQSGTIVARDKLDAFHKLKSRSLDSIRLKRIEGLSALLKRMTADIR